MTKTSIIITSYNQGDYICSAIESALEQTIPPIEVIVVDDGSSDGTQQLVLNRFSKSIVFLSQDRRGPSAAINIAMSQAVGEYIALLGGDDICLPNRLERQCQYLESESFDLVFCKPFLINTAGNLLADDSFPIFFGALKPPSFKELFSNGNILCAPSAFMRRKVLTSTGYFKTRLIQLQDYDYWLRAIACGHRIGIDDERVIYYRRHYHNLSRKASSLAIDVEMGLVASQIIDCPEYSCLFRECYVNCIPPSSDTNKSLTEFDKILILLGHSSKGVRAAGIARALKLLEDNNAMGELRSFKVDLVRLISNSLEGL